MFSKLISLLMSICMLITSAPLGGVVDEVGNIIDSISQKISDSVDGFVEALGLEKDDTSAITGEKDFVVTENAVDTWDGKTSTPTLSGLTYVINTAEELAWVASQYSNKFKGYTIQLNNDIDLAGHNWARIGGHSSTGGTSATYYFDGTFDGQGHTISNMTITETNYGRTGYVGFFGYVGENAIVKNVGLINPVITVDGATGSGNNYGVGALIGYCMGKSSAVTKVEKCFVRGGSVSVVDTGSNMGIGGLIGNVYYRADIKSCYVQGTTITSEPKNNSTSVGGLVGYVFNHSSYRPTLTSCYAVVNYDCYKPTFGSGNVVGGLVGNTPGKTNARYCYAAKDTTNYPGILVGGGSFYVSTGCAEVTSAVLKTYADVENTYLNASGEVYYPDNGKKNAGFPVFENEYIADTEVQEKIEEAEAAMDKSNYVYYAAIVKHSPDLFPNLQAAIDSAYAYLEDMSLMDKQVCLAALQTAIDAIKTAENTYAANPSAYKPIISISAPKTAYVFDGVFAKNSSVTIRSNYLLDPHSVSNNKGITLVYDSMDTEALENDTVYLYKYAFSGGTSLDSSDFFTVTYSASGTANGQTATASTEAKCLALKSASGSKSLDITWQLEYSAKDLFGGKIGTAELYFILNVSGIHGVSSSTNSVVYEKEDNSSKYIGREYSKYSGTEVNGIFYADINTENELAKVLGILDADSVKLDFNDVADEDDDIEDAQLTETVTISVNRIPDSAGDDYNNDPSQYYLGELNADLSGISEPVTLGGNLYSPNPQHGNVDVVYSMQGYADTENGVYVGGKMDFTLTYNWVDTKDLWKLYSSETDKINRFAYEDLYSAADEKAWEAYKAAYINAAQVLCGGVDQATIDAAKNQLVDAVRNLKTLVEYDLNGGESETYIEPTSVNIYSNVSVTAGVVSYSYSTLYATELKDFTIAKKTGYAPLGWSLTSDNNKDSVFDYVVIPESAATDKLTVYIVWELGAYTIEYNANAPAGSNAIGSMQNQVCQYNQSYTFSTCGYIIDNYNFVAWNTKADGSGTAYEPRASFENLTPAGTTITLYATWKENAANVTFNINLPSDVTETTSGFDKITVQELKVGSTVDLTKAPYKMEAEGYNHIGWATQAGASTPAFSENYTVPGNATTLYAVWQKKTATVIYNLNGGELKGDGYTEPNSEVVFGGTITLPSSENAVKPGYTLFGWKSSVDGQIYNDTCKTPDQSGIITFTAEWAPKTITITLHHNNNASEDVIVTLSGMYNTAIDPSKFAYPDGMDGYTFIGWYVNSDDGYVEYQIPTVFPGDDVDLFAAWRMDSLSEQISRFPLDIDGSGIYNDGTIVPYYQEPGKSIAKTAFEEASGIYEANEGVLYNYSDIDKTNNATAVLKLAIDALIPNPADYSIVDTYITYYYEMLPENQRPSDSVYADTHTYTYNGEEYEVSSDYFTTESFGAFANVVDSVVGNKTIIEQNDVDKYAEDLKSAYDALEPVEADYFELDYYINEAVLLNTLLGEAEGNLDDCYTETYGTLWYEEGSWAEFFWLAYDANTLPRDLNVFNQNLIDEYVNGLKSSYEAMSLNPPVFTVYINNRYLSKSNDIVQQDKVYSNTYRSEVQLANQAIVLAQQNSELSLRYDQDYVDGLIKNLGDLLENPQYKSYTITFYMNDGTGSSITETVACNIEIKGFAPVAPARDGYKFLGWYTTAEDTADVVGQKMDFETTTEIMGTADRSFYARWERTISAYTLDVSAVNGNLAVKIGNTDEIVEGNYYINENVFYGTKVVLEAISDSNGRDFMYWKDERGRIVSYDSIITFVLEANTTLTAVYSEVADSGYYTISFVDSVLNTVISEQKVVAGASATAPQMAEKYNDYVFVGWDKAFDNANGNLIVKAIYLNSEEIFTITIDVNGVQTEEVYRYNTLVTITITDDLIPDDSVFVGWSLDGGNTIASYDREYKFYAYKNVTVTAVFADAEAEATANVMIDAVIKDKDETAYKAEIMVSRYIPDDYVFVSSGVLLTKKSSLAAEDALTFEGQSENTTDIKLFRTVNNSNDGQYKLTINTSTESTVYVRGFVVYLDSNTGNVVTIYTDIQTIKP